LAAGAFASVMAFERGGIVPGIGHGDVVPAMLTPGEGVLPKKLMERINAAPDVSDGPRYTVHVHHSNTIHALDSDGVDAVLRKHGDKLHRHVENTLRKMNR
jgi:hypothetical protein